MKTDVKSPMAGSVQHFYFEDNELIEANNKIVGLESMKMMYDVATPVGGRIHYSVKLGQVINRGDVLAEVEES